MTGLTSPRPGRRRRRKVVINLCNCRYSVVEEAAGSLGWTVTRDEKAAWDIFWTDTSVSEERLLKLKKAQRINHFAGMQTLARKTSLARLLRRVASHMPSAFTFMPQTWILPNEGSELKKQTKIRQRWVIVKPDGSCQGKGIFLTNNAEKACAYTPAAVAQEYVGPFLIDGFKFDIRIYVLVTSCDPLRVYLYQEGIARFCTKPYCEPNEENSKEISMHLTNFAINKKSDNFTCASDGTSGFKRTLTSVWQWLDDHGHSSKDVINSIARLSVATLLSAQPTLVNTARGLNITARDDRGLASFELLGLDVLLDAHLQPWLLEVNHSPSFACESDMDKRIKSELLTDTLAMLHVSLHPSRWPKGKDKTEAVMRLNGALPSHVPPHDGERIRMLRLKHENTNLHLTNYLRVYPAVAGSLEVEFYQDLEQASLRAHAEGEAKGAREVAAAAVEMKPATPADAVRALAAETRGRSSLPTPTSASAFSSGSVLSTSSVSALSPQLPNSASAFSGSAFSPPASPHTHTHTHTHTNTHTHTHTHTHTLCSSTLNTPSGHLLLKHSSSPLASRRTVAAEWSPSIYVGSTKRFHFARSISGPFPSSLKGFEDENKTSLQSPSDSAGDGCPRPAYRRTHSLLRMMRRGGNSGAEVWGVAAKEEGGNGG